MNNHVENNADFKEIEQLLYIIASNSHLHDDDEKKFIRLIALDYGLSVLIDNPVSDIVEVTFALDYQGLGIGKKLQGEKYLISLQEITPFLKDIFKEKNERLNKSTINEIGSEQYNQWLEQDLKMLNQPKIIAGINSVEIEKDKPSGSIHITTENSVTGLNELIQFNYGPWMGEIYNLGYVKITSSHFKKEKDSYKCHTLTYHIPICQIKEHDFLKDFFPVETLVDSKNFLNHLIENNKNPEFAKALQYVTLTNNLEDNAIVIKKHKL
jgi:hypothetical protein